MCSSSFFSSLLPFCLWCHKVLHAEITFVMELPRLVWFYSFQNLKVIPRYSAYAFLLKTEPFGAGFSSPAQLLLVGSRIENALWYSLFILLLRSVGLIVVLVHILSSYIYLTQLHKEIEKILLWRAKHCLNNFWSEKFKENLEVG